MYNRPANIFVAGFIGSPSMNFLPGKIVAENGSLWLAMEDFRLQLPEREENLDSSIDKAVIVGFRPEDIVDSMYRSILHKTSLAEPLPSPRRIC